jgi:hypothetical protein
METQLYQDRFGVMIYDDARNILELRWLAETESMNDDDYMRWLERYAASAQQYHVPFTLIDTREFHHHPGAHRAVERGAHYSALQPGWREEIRVSSAHRSGVQERADARRIGSVPDRILRDTRANRPLVYVVAPDGREVIWYANLFRGYSMIS